MNQAKPTLLQIGRSALRSYLTDAGRTAARNLSWLAVLGVLTQLSALGNVFVLLHVLGKERFGTLGFALTLQSYLMILGSLGIKKIVIRDAAANPERLDTIVASHLAITGTASTLGLLVTLVVVQFVPVTSSERILLSLIALGNVAACLNIRAFYDVHHRQPASSAISLISEVLALAAALCLAHFDSLTLPNVGILFATKWTLATVLHYLLYHFEIRPIRLAFSSTHIRQMLASSWSLVLSALVARTPLNSGIFFVRAFHGEQDVAILFLAQRVARVYTVFTSIGNRILQPHIAGRYGLHASFIRKLALFFALFRGLVLVVAFAGAALVIWVLPDTSFRRAIVPMGILLIARFISGMGAIGTMYAVVLRRETVVLWANICASIVFVVGCLALVPDYSFHAAVGMAVCAAAVRVVLILQRVWSVRSAHINNSR